VVLVQVKSQVVKLIEAFQVGEDIKVRKLK
jgi:hypothetical protein